MYMIVTGETLRITIWCGTLGNCGGKLFSSLYSLSDALIEPHELQVFNVSSTTVTILLEKFEIKIFFEKGVGLTFEILKNYFLFVDIV